MAAVLILSGVQVVVTTDHLLMLPLGPDLAAGVGMPDEHLGLLVGAYTISAATTALLGARVLDRFQRHRALAVALMGLALAALFATLARDPGTLIAARVGAGAMGGPLLVLAHALVADLVPERRRGKAMALVLGGNALASVALVPVALLLAEHWGWQAPFFGIAGAAAIVAGLVSIGLTSSPGRERGMSPLALLARPDFRLCALMIAAAVGSTFALAPNLSAFLQHNLGLPRSELAGIYTLGGLGAVAGMLMAGRTTDRLGSTWVIVAASTLLVLVILAFLVAEPALLPLAVGATGLMTAFAARNVGVRTLATLVPEPGERAGFLSLLMAVQQTAAAIAAVGSTVLLRSDADGSLVGMERLGVLAIGLSLIVPAASYRVQRMRESRRSGP